MTVDMQRSSKAMAKAMLAGGLLMGGLAAPTLAGCGGGGSATVTERLWVSGVPTKPKDSLSAFVTMKSEDSKDYLGAFYEGSLLRGSHDVFKWRDAGKGHAQIELLQDGRTLELSFETCKPSVGFDHCIMVQRGMHKAVQYQSRKRWVVRRPGRKRDATLGLFNQALLEVANEDDELADVLDAAAAWAEDPSQDRDE